MFSKKEMTLEFVEQYVKSLEAESEARRKAKLNTVEK